MAQLQSTSITGSLIVTQGITGSFSGSISNATSASYAATASYALNAGDSVWTGSAGNIYYNGGNVGIGTTNPGKKLSVGGQAIFFNAGITGTPYWANNSFEIQSSNGDTVALEFHRAGYTSAQLYSDNGSLAFGTDSGAERMRIAVSTGNVGIGTTNPATKLQVNGTFASNALWTDASSIAYWGSYSTAYGGLTWDTGYAMVFSAGGAALRFGTNGSSVRMTIDTSGNVGIGITNPTGKLQVDGGQVRISNGGSFATLTSSQGLAFDLATSPYGIEFLAAVSGAGYGHRLISVDSGAGAGIFKIQSRDNSGTWSDTMSLRSGNVGIGTTNPTGQLTVAKQYSSYTPGEYLLKLRGGNGAINDLVDAYYDSDAAVFRVGYAGLNNSRAVINGGTSGGGASLSLVHGSTLKTYITADGASYFNGGNVGIGLTNPPTRLSAYRGLQTDTITIGNAAAYIWGADIGLAIGQYASGPYGTWLQSLRTDDTTWPLTLNPTGGNVGIGSSSPSYKLDVNGTFGTSGTAVFNGSATYINSSDIIVGNNSTDAVGISGNTMYFPGNGNVGIGTTSPSTKLEVTLPSTTSAVVQRWTSPSYDSVDLYIGSSQAYFGTISTTPLAFRTNNTEQMRITSGGNVGIGTTSPSTRLHVWNGGIKTTGFPSSGNPFTFLESNYSDYAVTVKFLNINPSNGFDADLGIQLMNGGGSMVDVFTIKGSSGNVGIGNTAPAFKLDVNGTVRFSAEAYIAGVWSTSYGPRNSGDPIKFVDWNATELVRISTTNGNVGIGTSSPTAFLDVKGLADNAGTISLQLRSGNSATNFNSNQITLGYSNSDTYRHAIKSRHQSGAPSGNAIDFYTWQYGGSSSAIGGQHVMSLDGANVGIGTTNPTKKLHVASSANEGIFMEGTANGGHWFDFKSANSNLWSMGAQPGLMGWYNRSDSSYKMVITDGGNVGINTTSPSYKLHVESSTNAAVAVIGASGYQTSVELKGADRWYRLISQPTAGNGGRFDIYDQTGGAYRLSINTDGNVGIGTTSPSSILQLGAGSYTATNSSYNTFNAGGFGVLFRDLYDAYLTFNTVYGASGWVNKYSSYKSAVVNFNDGRLDISTGTGTTAGSASNLTTRLVMTNDGNVGIGTTSPSAKLHVSAGSDYPLILDSTQQYLLGLYSSGTAEWWLAVNGGDLKLHENGVGDQVTFKAGGSVGIGTSSPSQKLDVNGYAKFKSGIILDGGATSDYREFIWNTSGYNRWDLYVYGAEPGSNVGGDLFLARYADNGAYLANAVTFQRSTGNVGIGTVSPSQKLHIYGSGDQALFVENSSTYHIYTGLSSNVGYVGSNNATPLSLRTNGISRLYVDISGNVGISTTNTFNKLTVGSIPASGYGLITISSDWASGTAISTGIKIGAANDTGGAGVDIRSHSNYAASSGTEMSFWTNSTGNVLSERMRITNNGNVGIGTTSPNYKLDVNGYVNIFSGNGLRWGSGDAEIINSTYSLLFKTYDGSALTEKMRITSAGNVGIGTTTPRTNLHVWNSSTGNAVEVARFTSAYAGTGDGPLIRFTNYLSYATNPNAGEYNLAGIRAFDFASSWGGALQFLTANNIGGGGNLIAAMTIDSSQLVGIGTNNPTGKLTISQNNSGGVAALVFTEDESTIQGPSANTKILMGGNLSLNAASTWVAATNGSERMRITSGGNVGIGTTSPYGKFQVNASNYGESPTINKALLVSDSAAPSKYLILTYHATPDIGIIQGLHEGTAWKNIALNPNGGNVGIGTTSIGYKLYVNGTSYFADTIYNGGGHISWTAGYSDGTTQTYNGNSLAFLTNSSSYTVRMFITSGGNIGIGTTAPLFNLQVGANSGTLATTTIRLQNSYLNTNGYYGFNIDAVDNGVDGHDLRFLGRTSPTGTFSELVRIKNSGNVGIGITSPSYKLDVYGDIRAGGSDPLLILQPNSGTYAFLQKLSTSNGDFLRLYDGTDYSMFWKNANVGIGTTSPSAKLHVQTSSTNLGLRLGNTNGTNWDFYSYNDSNLYINNSLGTVFTIHNSNGNVGIGTASPAFPLHVARSSGDSVIVADSGASSNSQFRFQEAGSLTAAITFVSSDDSLRFYNGGDRFTILSSGNVGIGTTSPSTKLHLYEAGASDVIFRITPADGSYDPLIQLTGQGNSISSEGFEVWYANSVGDVHLSTTYPNSAAAIRFHTATGASKSTSNERMTITGDGNVGIGVTNPSYKLQVAGTSWFTAEQAISYTDSIQSMYGGTGYSLFRMYGNSNGVEMQIDTHAHNSGAATIGTYSNSDVFIKTNQTNRMVVKAGGNVGIGTTSPNALLHVAGTIHSFPSTTDGILQASQAGSSGGLTTVVIRSNGISYFNGGNVGIGVTAPAAKLQVSGSTNVLNVRGSGSATTSSIFSVDGNNGRLFEVSDDLSNSLFSVNTIAGLPVIEAFADYTVTMGTYGAYSLQVTGSRVGVGTSSPGYPLHVSGSVSGISIYATNDIAAFSDQSVKTDLQVIDSAVDRIKQINGYTYVRVDDLSNTRRAGVIAQEVQKVLPEVVSENSDGTLNVAYSNMIALLIEGMKEQQAQIDKLREDLEDLRYEL